MPYRRPKRSYVLPVVTTLAVSAPLVTLQLADSTEYRSANDSEFAAVPAQLAEVVLSSVPEITLPLRELTGLELPDLRLSDLRRLPLPASIPVPEGLPLPPGVELPRQIPLPRLGSDQDPGKYSIPGQSPAAPPAPATNGQPAPAQHPNSTGSTPGPSAAVPGQTPPASGQIPGNTATVPGTPSAPNGAVAAPADTLAAPASTPPAPNGTLAAPAGTLTSPNGTLAAPVDSLTAPNGIPAVRANTLPAPNGTLAAPVDTLTAPNGTPAVPANTLPAPNGAFAAPTGTLPAPSPGLTHQAPMAFDQSSVEALLGMITSASNQADTAKPGDSVPSAQSPALPPTAPHTARFVADPVDNSLPGPPHITAVPAGPPHDAKDFVGNPTAPAPPSAAPIPGTLPGATVLAGDPIPAKPNGPIFGPETSPDTPALTPGAIPAEVLEQVGAQVKELSRDKPFSMVALTAKDLAGTKAMVRAKQPDGSWGPWYETEPVDTHRNDRGAPSRTRGTEPIYVGSTKAVQILVTRKEAVQRAPEQPAPIATPKPQGELQFPSDEEVFGRDVLSPLTAVLIDPGRGPIDNARTAVAAELPGGGPNVISRAGWGADESIRCEDPTYDDFLGGVTVHHTAGRNDYDKSESAGIVRAIYAYHAKTLGWCDIGYNALVDKYGQIFEGRAGGLDKPVQGAHAGGFNENTSGVALMGNHVSEPPTDAAIDAIGRFVGWRAKLAGLDPQAATVMESEGTEFTPIPQGQTIDLPIVFAHRDVGNTTCPGDAAYAMMDRIREIAADAPAPAPRVSQPQQRKANTAPTTMGTPKPADPQTAESTEKLAALTQRLLGMLNDNVIAKHWAAKGGASGPLGAPRSEPMPAARGGQYAKFVNGYVYSPPNGQVFEVAGSILDRFLALGGDTGLLGLPVSNVYPVLNGLRSDFQHGSLIVNELNGIITTVWKEINTDPYGPATEGSAPANVAAPADSPAAPPAPASADIPNPARAPAAVAPPAQADAPAPAAGDAPTPVRAPAAVAPPAQPDAPAPAQAQAQADAPTPARAPAAVRSPAQPNVPAPA